MSSPGEFDVVHVISDLHLGGEKGREMFTSEGLLAGWIESLRNESAERRLALVLAGDIVDFISTYRQGTYFCPSDAEKQLEALFGDGPEQSRDVPLKKLDKLRDALKVFVRTQNRTLVVLIGNHDVELAIPKVRERLQSLLCGDDLAVRARLVFAVDGQGWRCKVGGRVVYAVHGNEADWANANDYEGMRLVAAGLERGEQLLGQGERGLVTRYWKRNFGTSLVVDVLNTVRERAPFIDLLKPEGEPLADIVEALFPEMLTERITTLAKVGARGLLFRYVPRAARTARAFASSGTLGGDVDEERESETPRGAREFGTGPQFTSLTARDVDAMEALIREGRAPEELAESGSLGAREFVQLFVRQALGASTSKVLLESLKRWDDLRNYREIDQDDEVIRAYQSRIGPDVDVFIAGHTHAPRAIERGGRYYFNSGTWIDLVRIDEIVKKAETDNDLKDFDETIKLLKSGKRSDIETLIDRERICTVVTVQTAKENGADVVTATLHNASMSAPVGDEKKRFTMPVKRGSL